MAAMKNERVWIAALFNVVASSASSFASIFAFVSGHPVLGWLSASVAAVNLISAIYGAASAWRAGHRTS
jgi:hypothetical protein